ncbi:metallophosphoesterase family protein [Chitinimonas sp. PSY-7]|uniref:metallophosphoesterase family protein n=1 Tax=Chitinimonas sp. PSY-7 TaxID=3459088 RepID=UPI0040402734
MLLALMTDLHANRPALTACLEDAASYNPGRYIFLGDYVGYGAEPEWVVDKVMRFVEKGAIAVLGNHDASAVGILNQRMRPDAQAVIDWTKPRLNANQIKFLKGLPMTAELAGCYFSHANPWLPEDWDYVLNAADAAYALSVVPHKFIFCGHTHDPALYSVSTLGKSSHALPLPDQPFSLDGPMRWLAIPGSLGQPRDGNPDAAYALFDTDLQVLTYRRVPYDVDTAVGAMRMAGLPEGLAQRLERGG